METPLLEVKNLSVTFSTSKGIVEAVKNVSFTLNKGETLGIVGDLVQASRLLRWQFYVLFKKE